MLRLRSSIPTHIISSSVAFPSNSSLHRLLFATAAPSNSPNPSFAVEDYLVDTCGLTRAQALKASAKLSHLKSPSNPDAVRAFLGGFGISSTDFATLVARDPRFLCVKVDKTLSSRFAQLADLGLSRPDIVRFLSFAPLHFRTRSIVSKVQYYLALFGSSENLFLALKNGSYILGQTLSGWPSTLRSCESAGIQLNRILTTNPERVQAMVACAEGLGAPRGSGMFRLVLQAAAFLSEKKIAAKVDYLKKTFRWSDAEVNIAIPRSPFMLTRSKESLRHKSDFLFSEVGLEPAEIASFPAMINYSLDGRVRPRYYVVKFLKKNGLLDRDWKFSTIVKVTEKVFVEKFICPHKEAAPHLAQEYAAACRGEVAARMIFA